MQGLEPVFYIVILIFSVVLHEVAHGFAALRFGDETALRQGRLTLNPIKHLDPIGSVALPLLLILTNAGFVIGWAKPVPYDPRNIRPFRLGTLAVASAGVLVNFLLALLFGLALRFMPPGSLSPAMETVFGSIVLINIVLGVFNLIPIPPLDGSKILFALLPYRLARYEQAITAYSFIFLLIFIFFLWQYLVPVVGFIYSLITGA